MKRLSISRLVKCNRLERLHLAPRRKLSVRNQSPLSTSRELGQIRGSEFESYSDTCLVSYVLWLKSNANKIATDKCIRVGIIYVPISVESINGCPIRNLKISSRVEPKSTSLLIL